MRWLAVLMLVPTACVVTADYGGSNFSCTDQVCPEGLDCLGNRCVPSGLANDAGIDTSPSSDGSPSPDAAQGACGAGCATLETARDLCYCDEAKSWEAALADCQTTGRTLARIDNAATDNAIRAAISAEDLSTGGWLGGTDAVVEGEWRWIDPDEVFWIGLADGEAPAGVYTGFSDLEPNQFMGNEEDCLEMRRAANGWNDTPCGASKSYFCALP